MCGILAVIGSKNLERAKKCSGKISHRGGDHFGSLLTSNNIILCHERLAIIDIDGGSQPIVQDDGLALIHNGEIYNHRKLKEKYFKDVEFKTKSDSEIIMHLYSKFGTECLSYLDGVFSFVIADGEDIFVARDPLGVKPLFYGVDKDKCMWFASEFKALVEDCLEVQVFPPGHFYTKKEGFKCYYKPRWWDGSIGSEDAKKIVTSFTNAVTKRLMSDAPIAVLLSGGLDSSLVTAIAAREMKREGKTIKSFSVGLSRDCADLVKAREVADFLGTEHHEIIFSENEGIDLLEELIYKLESYDVTSIRASTPMYIMSKHIKKMGIKSVLSGEGADEMFGGYLYFKNAPSPDEFHKESLRRIKRLHTSDILRADRATMGVGLEARVPFLDQEFLDIVMSINPEFKMCRDGKIEKSILREAFNDKENPYLPDNILWRQKEQFSDGVGYSWIDSLKNYAEKMISDIEFSKKSELFPFNTPTTKEGFLYRKIFIKLFKHQDSEKLVKQWIPKWQKDLDPSGRANKAHLASYENGQSDPVNKCLDTL